VTGLNPIRDVIERTASSPDSIAIQGAARQFSNSVFVDTVVRIAAKLRADGVRPGSVVGLRMDPFLNTVFLAALMHEGAVSFVARGNIVEEYAASIDAMYSDDAVFAQRVAGGVHVSPEWLEGAARINPRIDPHDFAGDESLVHLVFSSGTTGTPKGVPFTLRDLKVRTAAARANWMPHLPFLSELGLDTVSGMQTYFWSLFAGETYLLPGSAVDDVTHIERARVQSIKTSPAKLKDLVAAVRANKSDVSSVKTVEVAGSLLSSQLAAAFAQVFDAELVYLYGSTEAGTITRAVYNPADSQRVGRVVPTARVEIVNETDDPIAPGETGAVRLQSDYQSTRYWPPTSSPTAFRGGWFYPGDSGFLDTDGTLVITGRTDELINASGLKINPAWVESHIGVYRGVSDFACFALASEEGTSELALAFVSENDINVDRFIVFLRDQLGDNAPRHVFRIAEIPRNSLGKVARLNLAGRINVAQRDRNSS
jgi:acyl-coenzyme A synthetase/AMP-(fatty) acid ligase